MDYSIHITRHPEGGPAAPETTISLAEWEAYVAHDPELRLEPEVAVTVAATGEVVHEKAEGLALWLAYSKNGRAGAYAWFGHEAGRITVQRPDEEILAKMLAVAQALRARVQGDDGEYFDEASQPYAAALADELFTQADQEFRPFQTFASAEAAQPLLAALARQALSARTVADNGQLAFDPSFANNQLTANFIVKLRLADFERASQVLAELNQHALSQADPAHYLFSFSDEELFDLLVKPDEWSGFDVALAAQLLRQRGRDVAPDTLRLLRQHRVAELAKPAQDHKAWVRWGYFSALLGGVVGLLIGWQLYFHRKVLPDGRRVYAYSPADRVHGLRILVLGLLMLVIILTARVLRGDFGE